MAAQTTPLKQAYSLFGEDVLGPEQVGRALSSDPESLAISNPQILSAVPYDIDTLRAARNRGELLVLRVPADSGGPLTMLRLYERFPDAFRQKSMKEGVGYLLKGEWTLAQEPFAASATCHLEWCLVNREPIAATCNLSYESQEVALTRHAASIGLERQMRRRSAVEIVYDTLLFHHTRGLRLLEHTWDWSDTPSCDGGYMTAGEFTHSGLHIVAYSRAVRFGKLGICAQH